MNGCPVKLVLLEISTQLLRVLHPGQLLGWHNGKVEAGGRETVENVIGIHGIPPVEWGGQLPARTSCGKLLPALPGRLAALAALAGLQLVTQLQLSPLPSVGCVGRGGETCRRQRGPDTTRGVQRDDRFVCGDRSIRFCF